jgi:hypothetical protein
LVVEPGAAEGVVDVADYPLLLVSFADKLGVEDRTFYPAAMEDVVDSSLVVVLGY